MGRHNSKIGGQRIYETFQYETLNRHLLYTVLDDFVGQMFPELDFSSIRP